MNRLLAAPSPQTQAGSNYQFVLWSDGRPPAHNIIVPPTNTAFTASFLPPDISSDLTPGGINLSWPQWASAMRLYASTNLVPRVFWSEVTDAPTISNGLFWLQVPTTNGNHFYRLQTP